jgi:hypothetical protein
VDPNPSGQSRTGTVWINGLSYMITQAPQVAAPSSVTSVFVAGVNQRLSFSFSDPAGVSDLSVLDILINNYLDWGARVLSGLCPSGSERRIFVSGERC